MNANRFSIFLNILFRVKQKTVVTLKVLMSSKNIPFFFLRSHYLGASLDYYHKRIRERERDEGGQEGTILGTSKKQRGKKEKETPAN